MLRSLARLAFPMVCPGCGAPGEPVCSDCIPTLLAAPSAPPPPGVDAWAAAFAYDGVAREVVARMKYRGMHAASVWLADRMAELADGWAPAVVTWAPTTTARRRARGFDHAELLGRGVGRRLRTPTRALLRRGPGPAQTGLPAAARRQGPVFAARGAVPASVLVVDDVTTTGATLTAAAVALRAAGAVRVVAVAAARTPAP